MRLNINIKVPSKQFFLKCRTLLINKREFFTYGVGSDDPKLPDYDRFVDSLQLMGTH